MDSLQQQEALEKLERAVERIERLVEEVAELRAEVGFSPAPRQRTTLTLVDEERGDA
jgi:hypothetical protein